MWINRFLKKDLISQKDNNIMPKLCVHVLVTATLRNNLGKAGRSSPQLLVQETT